MIRNLPGCRRVGDYLIHEIASLWGGSMHISRILAEREHGPDIEMLCDLPKDDWYNYRLTTDTEVEHYLASHELRHSTTH